MTTWDDIKEKAPLDWLLDPNNPLVRIKTLTDLLDRDQDDIDVIAAQQAISSYPDVVALLEGQEPDGQWGRPSY